MVTDLEPFPSIQIENDTIQSESSPLLQSPIIHSSRSFFDDQSCVSWSKAPSRIPIQNRKQSMNKASTEVLCSIRLIRSAMETLTDRLSNSLDEVVFESLRKIRTSITRISRSIIELEGQKTDDAAVPSWKMQRAPSKRVSTQVSKKSFSAPRPRPEADNSKPYVTAVIVHGMLESITKLVSCNRGTIYVFRDDSPQSDSPEKLVSIADVCFTRTVPLQKVQSVGVQHVAESGIMLSVSDGNRNSCIVPIRKFTKDEMLGVLELSDKPGPFTPVDESKIAEWSVVVSQTIETFQTGPNSSRTKELRNHSKAIQDVLSKSRNQTKSVPLTLDPLKVYRTSNLNIVSPSSERNNQLSTTSVEDTQTLREVSLYMERVEQCWKSSRDKVIALESKIEKLKDSEGKQDHEPQNKSGMVSPPLEGGKTTVQTDNIRRVMEKSRSYPSNKPLTDKHRYQVRTLLKLHESSQYALLDDQQDEVHSLLSLQANELSAPPMQSNPVPPWVRALRTVLTDRDAAYLRNKICSAADIPPFWNQPPAVDPPSTRRPRATAG